jgi:hypothetical protein
VKHNPYTEIKIQFCDNNIYLPSSNTWIPIKDWIEETSREAYCHIVKCPIHPDKGNELESFARQTIKYLLEQWLEEPKA